MKVTFTTSVYDNKAVSFFKSFRCSGDLSKKL